MTTVTVFTAERMAEIEAQAVVGASVVDDHLIMTRHNGTTFDAGVIDVTMIGNLLLEVDPNHYYRYSDDGTPITLVVDTYTNITDSLMNTEQEPVTWGHWDETETNLFVFDEVGFYGVSGITYIDSSGSSPGRSALRITTSVMGAGDREWEHTGSEIRMSTQLTRMFSAGEGIGLAVMSTHNIDVTHAELKIIKFDIVMEGTSEGGRPIGLRDISFVVDAGDSEISAGIKNSFMRCPYDCEITGWTILGDQTGSIVIDVWKDSYGNYPPTNADSITGSSPPTITTNVKATSTSLAGWDTSISAGDILEINVDSITAFTKVVLTLQVMVT